MRRAASLTTLCSSTTVWAEPVEAPSTSLGAGPSISSGRTPKASRVAACLALALAIGAAAAQSAEPVCGRAAGDKPLYLTLDTGHMGVAPLIGDVLARHQVRATFFLANERTLDGGGSLDDRWAGWWKARAAEGHVFASHTFDHAHWLADLPGGKLKVRPSAGPEAGRTLVWDPAQYCAALQQPAERFAAMTGQKMAPLFRAPGGKTSPALLAAARSCGWRHVGWSPAGFLGDELPSEQYSNAALLDRALRQLRPGDILLAHLGIWSRRDPWAPAVLEPLIVGLKSRGFCFATLREHPDFRDAFTR